MSYFFYNCFFKFDVVTSSLISSPMESHLQVQNGVSDDQMHHALTALQRNEYLHNQLVQNLAAAIYTCDVNGYITFYNKAAAELWGREPEIGKDLWCGSWKIFSPQDGKQMSLDDCPMAKALKGGKSVRGEEIVVERPDGVRRNILPYPDPIFDSSGEVIAAVNMLVDITELRNQENKLRQSEGNLKQLTKDLDKRVDERTAELKDANASLTSINKELEQFAFIASHDMQEPLRKIKTFTNRLEKKSEVLDEISRSYLMKIKKSSGRLENLIHDVLNYSRIGYLDNQFVEIDLNEILKNVREDFEVMIEERAAVITHNTLPIICAIPFQMNQLFYNIVGNSLKFCKEEEPCNLTIASRALSLVEVLTSGLDEKLSYCEITVKDNGIGFRQELAEAIFSIFKKLNGNSKYEGSGIGLALCRKIVNIHRGQIFARSAVDTGTTIHIILPLVKKML